MKNFDETTTGRGSRYILLFLGSAISFLVFLSLWQRNQMIHIGYEIERLHQERAELARIRKELMVEVESLATLERIEQIATRQLKMLPALPQQQVSVSTKSMRPPLSGVAREDRGDSEPPSEKMIMVKKGNKNR